MTFLSAFTGKAARSSGSLLPLLFVTLLLTCSELPRGPNVLFIVWDTTRSDRMSLYGYEKQTTPFLDQWARSALVFENCISTASSTVPAHGGLFTGLYPSEHGANNERHHLDDSHVTLAERFHEAGYDTYLFAANPHIAKKANFTQGFDVEEHPWDETYKSRALEIVKAKVDPSDLSSELPEDLQTDDFSKWSIKASGELAEVGLLNWLDHRAGQEKPFFAFLNYMEAHRPFIPARKFRERFMTPDEVEQSYRIDRSWEPLWEYTFGLREYTADELRIMGLTYDAGIAELDALFENLISSLEERGDLANTVIALTGDHGEHLGEHHMFDHQYSLYEGLLRVPLVLFYPAKIDPGRVVEPVINFDLFPTLLSLAGIEKPTDMPEHAIDLRSPQESRMRFAEYPAPFAAPIKTIQEQYPAWNPLPFQRTLSALYSDDLKLILASDGKHSLYDLKVDPSEEHDLAGKNVATLEQMLREYAKFSASLRPFEPDDSPQADLSDEDRVRLRSLGYLTD